MQHATPRAPCRPHTSFSALRVLSDRSASASARADRSSVRIPSFDWNHRVSACFVGRPSKGHSAVCVAPQCTAQSTRDALVLVRLQPVVL